MIVRNTYKTSCTGLNGEERRTAMQGAPRQGLEFREAVEEVAVRVSRLAGDVVQLLHVPRANAECEHGRAGVLQQVGRGSRVAAVAEAVGDQEHHLARRFTALFKDRLANGEDGPVKYDLYAMSFSLVDLAVLTSASRSAPRV